MTRRTRQQSSLELARSAVQAAEAARADDELRQLLAERQRREVRSSMLSWATYRLGKRRQVPARHHRLIIDKLERVTSGKCDRLMILAPPGSAKSTYSTKLFVPYFFTQHPDADVISASHTSSLAGRFGREVRNMVDEEQEMLGFSLREDSRAVDMWNTDRGGAYIAVGVGMAVAGTRADLVLIDDPFKGREDADSEVQREKVWAWYTGDIVGRLKPGARIVLIMTRWHEDDLGGRLLREMEDGTGDDWEVLSLEALCEHPETDPLGRQLGEALWPEWESAEKLLRKKRTVGRREWACQYQQNPIGRGVNLIPEGGLVEVPTPPSPVVAMVRAWDYAGTEEGQGRNPDWTVGLLLARMENGQHIVLDVRRARVGPLDVDIMVLDTAHDDGEDVDVCIPRDVGQAGKAQAEAQVRMLAGFRVHVIQQTGSKIVRATPVISQIEAGQVLVLRRRWTSTLVDECESFPAGDKDDQVDALAAAFNWLVANGGSANIIDYYRELLAMRGSGPQPRTITSEYEVLYAEALGEQDRVVCAACQGTISDAAGRVSDGVQVWHQECHR